MKYKQFEYAVYPESSKDAARLLADKIKERAESSDGTFVVAIDGRSACGKSTLAMNTAKLLDDALVIHMDDFFLRPGQRTRERLSQPGENLDHERLRADVLDPLLQNGKAIIEPYSCKERRLMKGYEIQKPKILILEGAYSANAELEPYSSYRVFATCSVPNQRKRIIGRNGYDHLIDFERKWIPLEEYYFSQTKIEHRVDLIINLDGQIS